MEMMRWRHVKHNIAQQQNKIVRLNRNGTDAGFIGGRGRVYDS